MHLLLHVGPPKTGSTAIQSSLFANRDRLGDAGILLFPAVRGDLPQRALSTRHAGAGGFHKGPLRRKFATPEAARDWSAGQWDSLAGAVRQSDADLCVISSEHFGYNINVADLLADFGRIFQGITVLSYVRDPVSLYFSLLQQNLRGGAPLTRIKTPRNFKYRLRATIEQYHAALGAENVMLRNFARDNLQDGDVVQDFFAQLTRFGKTVRIETVRANESLPGAALAFLMLMNETFVSGQKDQRQQQIVRRLIRSGPVAGLAPFKPQMPLAKTLIQAHTAEDCDWFNRTFLAGQTQLAVARGGAPESLPESPSESPSDAEWRAQIRDELLTYLTRAALAVLGQEIVGL